MYPSLLPSLLIHSINRNSSILLKGKYSQHQSAHRISNKIHGQNQTRVSQLTTMGQLTKGDNAGFMVKGWQVSLQRTARQSDKL